MLRLRIVTTAGQETSLTVNSIISIDGRPYDPDAPANLPPEDRLTKVEQQLILVEAAIGFCLARIGTIDLSPEDGSEQPSETGVMADG